MKRLAGFFLLGITLAFLPACKTVKSSAEEGIDLAQEVNRLQSLYKGAVRVPITRRIVDQIRKETKDYLLGEIRYFTSVNIALTHSRTGESSMTLETRELPRIRQTVPPAQNGQNAGPSPQDTGPDTSVTFQEIPVLTFREGGSSLNQHRITSDDEGHLKDLSPGGDVFEIHYPEWEITLGFILNREENWYDLEFAIDDTTGERTSLAMTGVRPHLMINYQSIFSSEETQIQMDKSLRPTEPPPKVREDRPAEPVLPLPGPVDPVPPLGALSLQDLYPETISPRAEPPASVEDRPSYPGESFADLGGKDFFYLEEALPTPWGDMPEDTEVYPSQKRIPEVDVVFLEETASPAHKAKPALPSKGNVPINFAESSGQDDCYVIQVGAFRDKQNASSAFAALKQAGFCPFYESHRNLTRVLISGVGRGDLPQVKEKVKSLGFGKPYVRR